MVNILPQKQAHSDDSHHTLGLAQQGVERNLASLSQVMEQSEDRSHQELRHLSYQQYKQVSKGMLQPLSTLRHVGQIVIILTSTYFRRVFARLSKLFSNIVHYKHPRRGIEQYTRHLNFILSSQLNYLIVASRLIYGERLMMRREFKAH
jgi:hypothetical protein